MGVSCPFPPPSCLSNPNCTFPKSISETPVPASGQCSPSWVALAAQLCLPQFLQTQTQARVAALPLPQCCWPEGYPAVTAHRCGPFPCPQPPWGSGPSWGASASSGPWELCRDVPTSRGGGSSLVSEATTLL